MAIDCLIHRAFLLMLPAATQMYCNKTKFFFSIRNEFNSHRIGFTDVVTVLLFGGGIWLSRLHVKTLYLFCWLFYTLSAYLYHVCLMIIVWASGSSGLGLSSGRGYCAVFLGKTLCSHRASLHPGVYIDSSEIKQNAGGRGLTL